MRTEYLATGMKVFMPCLISTPIRTFQEFFKCPVHITQKKTIQNSYSYSTPVQLCANPKRCIKIKYVGWPSAFVEGVEVYSKPLLALEVGFFVALL